MAPKKKKTALKKHQIVYITKPTCDGNTEIIDIYLPKEKMFIKKDHRYVHKTTLHEKFDDKIYSISEMGPYLVIPEMKKRWNDFLKTVKPLFKEGDDVVIYHHMHNQLYTPVAYTVGEITGYSKSCDSKTKESTVSINRKVINIASQKVTTEYESEYLPLEEIEKFQQGKKVITAIRKICKEDRIIGATITYKGKAYRL